MNLADIGVAATVATLLAFVLTVGAMRLLPPRADSQQGQSAYLMNQLVAKTGEADRALAENRELRVEVEVLRKKVAVLEAQVSDMWARIMAQNVRIDANTATANTAYNEPRKAAGRVTADVMMSEDIPFRDWLVAHFDLDDMRILVSDLKLAEFPVIANPPEAATRMIREARKTGKLSALEAVALEARPSVPAW